ncbi:hypothetical protein PSPO_b0210 [Pseudoalteromonas spongiae UST010723-006]|nr:hypothetical protein PSPO_b0210 [Pseudoalteromonas spongiae UST010723-006]
MLLLISGVEAAYCKMLKDGITIPKMFGILKLVAMVVFACYC